MREGFHAGRALLRRSWIGDQEKKLEEITAQERLERVRVMRVCVCVCSCPCVCAYVFACAYVRIVIGHVCVLCTHAYCCFCA